jgi:hypothetical protein
MAIHAAVSGRRQHQHAREVFAGIGIEQHRLARLFGVGARSVRRWQAGDRAVPVGVVIVARLMSAGLL